MCDMLADAGWPINRFDFGGKAGNSSVYYNRGCEIWMKLSRAIEKGEIVLIHDPTLISQLPPVKFSTTLKAGPGWSPRTICGPVGSNPPTGLTRWPGVLPLAPLLSPNSSARPTIPGNSWTNTTQVCRTTSDLEAVKRLLFRNLSEDFLVIK